MLAIDTLIDVSFQRILYLLDEFLLGLPDK